jgi:hypothetical protein
MKGMIKMLTTNQCRKKLNKHIKGTEWEGDTIEWWPDQDLHPTYKWKAFNPETKVYTCIVCNKETGVITQSYHAFSGEE